MKVYVDIFNLILSHDKDLYFMYAYFNWNRRKIELVVLRIRGLNSPGQHLGYNLLVPIYTQLLEI